MSKFVESPCVKFCKLDPVSGYCLGCYRTIEEIAAWPGLGREEKQQVYKELEKRKRRPARECVSAGEGWGEG